MIQLMTMNDRNQTLFVFLRCDMIESIATGEKEVNGKPCKLGMVFTSDCFLVCS